MSEVLVFDGEQWARVNWRENPQYQSPRLRTYQDEYQNPYVVNPALLWQAHFIFDMDNLVVIKNRIMSAQSPEQVATLVNNHRGVQVIAALDRPYNPEIDTAHSEAWDEDKPELYIVEVYESVDGFYLQDYPASVRATTALTETPDETREREAKAEAEEVERAERRKAAFEASRLRRMGRGLPKPLKTDEEDEDDDDPPPRKAPRAPTVPKRASPKVEAQIMMHKIKPPKPIEDDDQRAWNL